MAENGVNGGEATAVEVAGEAAAVEFTAMKPRLVVPALKADKAAQFCKEAFGAVEVSRSYHSKRKFEEELPVILAIELKIGSAVFIVSEHSDDSVAVNPFVFCLETKEVEAAVEKALKAGATKEPVVGDNCDGALSGAVKDPYGYVWSISSSAVPVPPPES